MTNVIMHGIILAFGLILPLGVQNIFIFNQGASQPSLIHAFPVIITAALCDTLLILLAVLGVSAIVLTFSLLKTVLLGLGVIFLGYMGGVIWKSETKLNEANSERISTKKQVLFAISVSVLNPHAIIDIIGVIGTNSLNYSGEAKWVFTFSTILVSWIWFFGLAIGGKMLGNIDKTGRLIHIINKISAFIIWSIALYLLKSFFESF
ncbi:amino acid transporter [Bacillus aquiflavi]|uniref:Amino acid transporter n=1 Tax=Bacillus aquiflavi TaxID=2672567 RepID=A0A6B3VXU0_9BACI|nr:LysE/ArgO family amino acid transporter [Bacillus aquiflavi]MBA4536760.1 amino acid transporter [Bacillus aquiflavi]NEY81127.1 amino acid transporter [Bacillus aquiflavi]UAC49690.1 LysE/ArgO family amino acid transporter [Bacillus aquiflavi]